VVLKILKVAETISRYKAGYFEIICVLYLHYTAVYGPYTRNCFSLI